VLYPVNPVRPDATLAALVSADIQLRDVIREQLVHDAPHRWSSNGEPRVLRGVDYPKVAAE
jgi:hypothetical protein